MPTSDTGDGEREAAERSGSRSSVSLPRALRVAHLVPAATLVMVVAMSMIGFYVVGGTFQSLADAIKSSAAIRITDLTRPAEAASLASASWIWAGAAFAAGVTTISTLVVCVGVILDSTPRRDAGRPSAYVRGSIGFLVVFFGVALLVDLLINGSNPYTDLIPGPGDDHEMARAIYVIISVLNSLTMTIMAGLLAASTAIILGAQHLDGVPVEDRGAVLGRLQRHLTVLLGAGAVATVVGVLEITALFRVPPAALVAVSSPGMGEAQIDANAAELKTVIEGLGAFAGSLASYWGVVFTLGLGLLYLPAAWAIRARAAALPAPDPSAPSAGRMADMLKPLAKILTALAPLLVGALGQMLSSTTGLL